MSAPEHTPQTGRPEVDVVIRDATAAPNSRAFVGAVKALSGAVFGGSPNRAAAREALELLDAANLSRGHRVAVWSHLAANASDRILRQDLLVRLLMDPSSDALAALSRLVRGSPSMMPVALAEVALHLPHSLDIAVGAEKQRIEQAHVRLQTLRIPVEPFGAKHEDDRTKKLQRVLGAVKRGETSKLHEVADLVMALLLHGSSRCEKVLSDVVQPTGRSLTSGEQRAQVIDEVRRGLEAMVDSVDSASDKEAYREAGQRLSRLIDPPPPAPRAPRKEKESAPQIAPKPSHREEWGALVAAAETVEGASAAFTRLAFELGDSVNNELSSMLNRFRDQAPAREIVFAAIRARPSLGRLEILTRAAQDGVPGVPEELILLATGSPRPAPSLEVRRKACEAFWSVGRFDALFRGPRHLCNLFEKESEQHVRGLFSDREHVQSFIRDQVLSWPNRREALLVLMSFRWYRLLTPRDARGSQDAPPSPGSRKLFVAFQRARQADRGPKYTVLEPPFGELVGRMSPSEIATFAPIENCDQLGTLSEVLRLYPPSEAHIHAVLLLMAEAARRDPELCRAISLLTHNCARPVQRGIYDFQREAQRWSEVALVGYCVSITDAIAGDGSLSAEIFDSIPREEIPLAIQTLRELQQRAGQVVDRFLDNALRELNRRLAPTT